MTASVTDVKCRILVLLILLAEIGLSLLLKVLGRGLDETLYRILTVVIAAAAIGLMLGITGWRLPMKSKLKPLHSVLFLFGAFMTIHILTNVWADMLRSSNPAYSVPGSLGNVTPGSAATALSIIFSVIIAPIKEEMIYRVGFLSTFKSFMHPIFALLLSTAIFTTTHIGAGSTAWNLVPISIAGLVLGITYMALGLPWSIALHFLLNLIPLLSEKGIFRHTLDSDLTFFAFFGFALAALWIFISRIIRLRKAIFGASQS